MEGLLLQVGIAGPLVLSLIVLTAQRRDRSPAQRTLFWLLVMIFLWMAGMVVHGAHDASLRPLAALLLLPPACFMAPLFCLLMAQYARIELLDRHPSARFALLAPFALFLAGFATQAWRGSTVGTGGDLTRLLPANEASALLWAFQLWSNGVALVGFGICARLALRTPSPDERRRVLLLGVAALVPLVAHGLFSFRVLPFEEPLTPAALGVTSLLLVVGMARYRLLEVQPIARRDVIEASSDAVIVADAEERVVDLNPAAAALFREPRTALCGIRLGELLGRLEPTQPAGALARALETLRAAGAAPLTEIETTSGRVFELSAGTPRDAGGAPAGHFVVLRDRSAERRVERLLHQSQKLESVGVLAAGVAHEVNNPLAFLRANLGHLQAFSGAFEERRDELPKELLEAAGDMPELIDESIAGLERIHEIVQGLLRFSRMPSGRVERCDPNAIVAEAARFASLDRSAQVRLETRFAEGLPRVEAAPDQLVQVVLNLLLNARQALKGRGDAAILASTRAADGGVEIRIADNGPGVPESIRPRIFDPFFTTRPPNEGTGLGLPIALDIVSRHGGTLELEPEAGAGACFVVRLPGASDAGAP
jgi:signal transduction histidine kinase